MQQPKSAQGGDRRPRHGRLHEARRPGRDAVCDAQPGARELDTECEPWEAASEVDEARQGRGAEYPWGAESSLDRSLWGQRL